MIQSDEILTNFNTNSASFENLYSSHDSKCDYAKRPFRTFDANAKEKDYESGFHYYGSRYYSSELSIWNSTDPMADKYPSLTPYNYCANNPVKLIDPNGEEIWINGEASDKAVEQLQNKMQNLQISRADNGKIFVSGDAKTKQEKEFIKAINNSNIVVKVEALNQEKCKTDVGDAFLGNKLNKDKSIVIANHYVNPDKLATNDTFVGDDVSGALLLHGIMESYYGGELSLQRGVEAQQAIKGKINPIYEEAHRKSNEKIYCGEIQTYFELKTVPKPKNIIPGKLQQLTIEKIPIEKGKKSCD